MTVTSAATQKRCATMESVCLSVRATLIINAAPMNAETATGHV